MEHPFKSSYLPFTLRMFYPRKSLIVQVLSFSVAQLGNKWKRLSHVSGATRLGHDGTGVPARASPSRDLSLPGETKHTKKYP